ncbi:alpha/beta fold hydrolase [Streptomyces sp. Y7]|uniref:alpha/beta fold hydrolase n=1 Tax=Streptomyces sp. Y7 TaxID=3342392 RepID=UPI00371945CE
MSDSATDTGLRESRVELRTGSLCVVDDGDGGATLCLHADVHQRLLCELGAGEVGEEVIGSARAGRIADGLALLAPHLLRSLLPVAPAGMPAGGSAPDVFGLSGPAPRAAAIGDSARRAAGVRCPPTVVWDAADGVIPQSYAEERVASLQDGRMSWVQGAGHLPHAEDFDGFLSEVGRSDDRSPLWN